MNFCMSDLENEIIDGIKTFYGRYVDNILILEYNIEETK